MKPIQPILLALLGVGFIIYLRVLRSRILARLIGITVFGAGTILVVSPELSNDIAHRVGVGRGVDLVMYVGLVVIVQVLIQVFARTRQLEAQLTVLARSIAINNAKSPES